MKGGWVYRLAVLAASVENRRKQDTDSCLKELGLHRNVLFLFKKKGGGDITSGWRGCGHLLSVLFGYFPAFRLR